MKNSNDYQPKRDRRAGIRQDLWACRGSEGGTGDHKGAALISFRFVFLIRFLKDNLLDIPDDSFVSEYRLTHKLYRRLQSHRDIHRKYFQI